MATPVAVDAPTRDANLLLAMVQEAEAVLTRGALLLLVTDLVAEDALTRGVNPLPATDLAAEAVLIRDVLQDLATVTLTPGTRGILMTSPNVSCKFRNFFS